MESHADNPVEKSQQPFQFSLSKLIQLMTVAALWCSAGVACKNVTIGMAYAVVTAIVTWIVVGRWSVSLSPRAGRRVLAATTALMVGGGVGVTVLLDGTDDYVPLVWLPTAMLAFMPLAFVGSEAGWLVGIVGSVASGLLMLLIIYLLWLLLFGAWDRWSARPGPGRLVWSFSALIALLALPLALTVLTGCYTFSGHGEVRETKHVWLHCVIHVGMLAAAGTTIGLLQRHSRCATGPPPNWMKLLTLGYLCLYAVLLQVALFPINFYIP